MDVGTVGVAGALYIQTLATVLSLQAETVGNGATFAVQWDAVAVAVERFTADHRSAGSHRYVGVVVGIEVTVVGRPDIDYLPVQRRGFDRFRPIFQVLGIAADHPVIG